MVRGCSGGSRDEGGCAGFADRALGSKRSGLPESLMKVVDA